MAKLDSDVDRLEVSVNSLLKLLGGSAAEREHFWEILKGITTPVEYRLAKSSIVAAGRDVATVTGSLTALEKAAAETKSN